MKESILIIDEYDYLLFDGKSEKVMAKNFEMMNNFYKVIGISGSSLNDTES